jgi:hypothetical protein
MLQEGSFDRLGANIQVICKRQSFEDSEVNLEQQIIVCNSPPWQLQFLA